MAGKRKAATRKPAPRNVVTPQAAEFDISGLHVHLREDPAQLPKTEAPRCLWGTVVDVRADDPKGQEQEALRNLLIAAKRHSWTLAKDVYTIGRGIYFGEMTPIKEEEPA